MAATIYTGPAMRRAVLILVLLLAGAVVNVAVAWACTLWSPIGGEVLIEPVPRDVAPWFDRYCPFAVEVPARSDVRRRGGLGLQIQRMCDPIDGRQGLYVASWRTTAGFPMLCLDGALWECGDHRPIYIFSHARRLPESVGPLPVQNMHYAVTLPLRPVWPGFAANTIFYAGIAAMLVYNPWVIRRLLRHRRRLCPSCAYPMGRSAVCTECGRALPGRAEAVA